MKTPQATDHQLVVTLNDVKPRIWRRLVVPSDATLADVHLVLQVAMGWFDGHLHEFRIGDVTYGMSAVDPELTSEDEGLVTLAAVAPAGTTFEYLYDFGDNWVLTIKVESVDPPEGGVAPARCIAGERAGPPDDSGGVWGYANLLEALADPKHPDYEDLREWAGDDFNPERFDIEGLNETLATWSRATGR